MTSAEKSYNLNTLYSTEENLDWYPQVAANPYGPSQPPGYGSYGADYLPQRGAYPSKNPSYSYQQNYSAGQSYPQAQRPPQQQQGYTVNQTYPQPPPSQQPGLGQTYPQAPPPPMPPQQGYPTGQTYPQPQQGYAAGQTYPQLQQGYPAGQTGYPPQASQPQQQGYPAGQAYPQPPPSQQPGLSYAWQQGGGYPPQDQPPVYQGYPQQSGYDQPWQQGGGGLYPPPPTYSTAYAPQQGTAAPLYSQSYQRVESVSTNAQHPEYKTTKTKESRSRSFSQGLRDLFHKDKEVVPATHEVKTRSRSLSEGLRAMFGPEGHSKAALAEDQGLAAEETLVVRSTERTGGGEQHEEKKEGKKQKMVDSVATGLKAMVVAGEALHALDVLSSLAS